MLRSKPPLCSLALLALLALPATALAQRPSVAIVAAASNTISDCRFTDPQQKLLASGRFSRVDIIDAGAMTPTLIDLRDYDAVLVWSTLNFHDSVALGNVLADFVDQDRGVVVATFANTDATVYRSLQGRWLLGYEVLVSQGGSIAGPANLGTVHVPGHPIMLGVDSLDGGPMSFRPSWPTLSEGSALLAKWNDGKPLAAVGANPRRADLGMVPPSDDCDSVFWSASTDGARLMTNALLYTAGVGAGTAYCFGDGTGAPCPCANVGQDSEGCANSTGVGALLGSWGTVSVAAADLTLEANQVPAGRPGIYFQGDDALNGGLGSFFGDGLRCAGGNLVRLEVTVSNAEGLATTTIDLPRRGGVAAGDVRRYQYWYRDPNVPVGSPCGSAFNLSNGLEIHWLP